MVPWSIHLRILDIVNMLFHFIYFHFRMVKLLVQFVCFFTVMVCIYGFDNDQNSYINCRRDCFVDYNFCLAHAEDPLEKYENCLVKRNNCLKDCYELNDEISESELTEADKVILEDFLQ